MARERNKRQPVPAADLTGSIIAALKKELVGELPPEGWYSISKIAEMLGISFEATSRLAKRKKWPAAGYMTTTSDGRRLNVRHFYIL